MTNSEEKKANWKKIKVEFLAKIPKRFKIDVEGLDDDSNFFHPVITIDDGLIIKGQCDANVKYVYGLTLNVTKDYAVGGYIYNTSMNIDEDGEFEYLVNNYDKIKDSLKLGLAEIEKIHALQNDLTIVQNDIIFNSISKEIDKSKLKDSISKLYTVTEYLENKRLDSQ